jgi:transposase
MNQLARMIRDRNPLQLNFTFALSNRAMVRELIGREFGVRVSETSVGRLLRRLGFSPQRPLHRAYEQEPTSWDSRQAMPREEFPDDLTGIDVAGTQSGTARSRWDG